MVLSFDETKALEELKHKNGLEELAFRSELDCKYDNLKTENQLKVLQKQKEIAEIQAAAVQNGAVNVEVKDPMRKY